MPACSAGSEHHREFDHCVYNPVLLKFSGVAPNRGQFRRDGLGRLRVSASTIPMVSETARSEEPPDEMNGSVIPLAGIRPTLTAMLMTACSPNSTASPATACCVNPSG